MANNQRQQTSTSTQIRNFYSDGMSYMNTSFFNTNFSLKFHAFIQKDQNGKSVYDLQNGIGTTVNFDGAYALYQAAKDIIDGKTNEMNLPIPCNAGATLTLERKLGQDGTMETVLSIAKNNMTIPFKFKTMTCRAKENGQLVTKTIECGLGSFSKTLEGYLTGINSDRHLDKLTDDFAKLQQNNGNNTGGNNNNQQYQNNGGGYRKNYNNGYRKPYNNNNQYGNNNSQGGYNGNTQGRQQDFSTYQINN